MQKIEKKLPVSEKNTKGEILDAYHTLLAQLDNKEEPSDTVKKDHILIEKTSNETVEKIVNDLSQLKLTSNQTITSLTDKLTQEAERLTTIRKAITIAQRELEETQKVKITADQLYQLIEIQKKQELEFNTMMENKRNAWEEEQKEYTERLKRERTREEEDYAYKKHLERKRATEEWEETRRKQERQIEESEMQQKTLIKELEELRKTVAIFPSEKEKEVKAAVAQAIAEVKKEASVSQSFTKQEADNKAKLADAKIISLENIIKSQDTEIKELKRNLEEATRHIKDIAVSIVEGSKREISSTKPSVSESIR